MKKNLHFIIIGIIFLCLPLNIRATEYTAYINANSVNIRKGAGTGYSIIKCVSSGTSITVYDKTLYSGTGCSAKWYKINYNGSTGYVCSTYVSFNSTSFSGMNTNDWTARINSNNTNARTGSSTSYKVANVLSLGTNLKILDKVKSNNSGCSTNYWYKVNYYTNKTAYVCSKYVTLKSDITATDSEYATTLKNEGFPDSYVPYLTYLHKKYPNWIFKASKTNLDFTKAVSSENYKNYIQMTSSTMNKNYLMSTTPSEGSTWYTVNSSVVAFYLDPRNWLTKDRIFMFEKLSYSEDIESQYPTLVKAIFGTGSLSDDKYTTPMVNAGKTNKISPVHIASRIKQEVSASGSSSTSGGKFTWKGKTYSGYYNFFNIGAYEVKIDGVSYSAVTRGLAYAAKLISRDGNKWDNIETAITEGSAFLAKAYINKGQDTLYYQKFNVGPNAAFTKYTHQYMTNIQAPAVEGNSSYSSYSKASVLSNTFVFEIPVYNNMPEYTSLPGSEDTNDNLEKLEITGYTLTPEFDEDILTYEIKVPTTTKSVTVSSTSSSAKATITGNGTIELKSDSNDITITVKSESGSTKQYIVTVTKDSSLDTSTSSETTTTINEVISTSKYNVKNNVIYKLKNGTKVETVKNALLGAGATDVKVYSGKTEVSDSSVIATNQTIVVTTKSESKTYTLSVLGDTSGDGSITILDLLQVLNKIKKVSSLNEAAYLSADTSNDGDVTILDLLQVLNDIQGTKKL